MRKVNCNKQVFTSEQEQFVRDNYLRLTNQQLADEFGMKLTTLRTRVIEMGLKRMNMEYWTDEQVQFLKDNYREYGDTELAEMFEVKWRKDKGWHKRHINKKRGYLGLQRTTEERKAISKRNTAQGRFSTSHWKRWDGKTCPVGECRVWKQGDRSFVVIKLKGGFVPYAHWLYEQIYGKIPKGHVVTTKDDNQLNISLSNLKLTTRAEMAAKNSKFGHLPGYLKDTIKVLNKLNKKIYEKQDFGFEKPHVCTT